MKPNIDIVDSLRSHPTSAGLDDDLLITIAQYARLLVVRAGDVVHPLGEPISDALFVTAGRLEMVFRGRDESFTATHLAAIAQTPSDFHSSSSLASASPASAISVACSQYSSAVAICSPPL